MPEEPVTPIQAAKTTMSTIRLVPDKPKKTAADWVRDMRMSPEVNKTTVGVDTASVTGDLLLATANKLLGISRRKLEPDPKDSLEFQRFYGPAEYFAEHVMRDGNKLGRNILWKATNQGNLDFMPVNALDKHISDVYYDSKLAQMIDGSSPLETVDASYKTTRIGEGGVGDLDSAPEEMRTVQPSFLGFIDPVRCYARGTEVKTKEGWKAVEAITKEDDVLTWVDGKAVYVHPTDVLSFDYFGEMIGYNDGVVAFLVTPHHRMWIHIYEPEGWKYDFAENVVGDDVMINISEGDTPEPYVLNGNDWYKISNKPVGKVYCLTVAGGLVYCRYLEQQGFVCGQSPESFRVGLDVYMAKNVMKGSDGKLYQKFINAHTGKEELVDSETLAKSVVTTPDMMKTKTKSVFAMGGPTGVRIVPRKDVDYYLPRADEAYSLSSNMVTMPSAVIGMRLLMGCLHPETNVFVANEHNMVSMVKARYLTGKDQRIPGMSKEYNSLCYGLRNTITKCVPQATWFKKIVLRSGRVIITSYDHKWPVLIKDKMTLVQARDLRAGDTVFRTTFKDVPNRRTFLNKHIITRDVAFVLGLICRSVYTNHPGSVGFCFPIATDLRIKEAIQYVYRDLTPKQFHITKKDGFRYMTVKCKELYDFVKQNIGFKPEERRIPSEILSGYADVAAEFINGYTSDETKVGIDCNEDIWVLFLPNMDFRDQLAFLFARIGTDTLYRDASQNGELQIALKINDQPRVFHDMYQDTVKYVWEGPKCPIMVDIDINDNMYAVANGIVTHNSKYPLQAVSLDKREAPLVRTLDEASGKDMAQIAGKFLGARFADRDGMVTAVRKDRIDVLWDDGTKGAVPLYVNFPMNAKGYINNTPVVKAGQSFKKGDCLAASNYTDKTGTAALGINLRTGWISWKGGTYEDAVVISEEAAKKLTSTTMYNTSVDLDKTVSLGKRNYITWKPAEYTKEQMQQLDDNGIVKPGTVLHKGDPMILAIRTSEPSPGTMGKRILTDLSETWDHDHDGVVTDVVKTRKGVKVYTTVTAPAEVGDKIAGLHGNKGTIAQILPADQMPQTQNGTPLDICFSPLGITSRNNTAQLYEALLAKVAKKTGKTQVVPAFYDGDLYEYVQSKLKEAHVHADEDLVDPETGRTIPNILTGYIYTHKLKHLAESKMSARGTGEYAADETPSGKGMTGAKRFGSLEIGSLVGHCLMGLTRVLTKTGYMPIEQIVRGRLPVEVLSYNQKTDQFEWKQVTDWFARSVRQEDLWRIQTNARQDMPSEGALRGYHHELRCTKEHKILTPDRGYVQACELKPGDLVYNRGPVLLPWQKQIILGTVMGDGYLGKYKNKLGTSVPNLRVVHGPKQHAYTFWMYEKLRNICKQAPSIVAHSVISSKGFGSSGAQARFATVSCYELSVFRNRFYKEVDGKDRKVVPHGIIKELGWAGIAVWFMDDGSVEKGSRKGLRKAMTFHTCSFTPEECQRLCDELHDFTGLDFSVLMKGGKYPIIRLNSGPRCKTGELSQTEIFSRSLAPYITEDFRYKLGDNYPVDAPVGSYWEDKVAPDYTLHGEPCEVIASRPDTEPPFEGYIAYDITVPDNHNFIAAGIVVSNSAFENLKDAKILRGQSNADFWRSIRTGNIPTMPGEPLVHKKFFAHLIGSGVNVRKTQKGVSAFALSSDDVEELAGPRELKTRDTYETRNFRPIDGGLFGQDIFGINGDKWAYIKLDEPVPNPVMEEPLARLLRMPDKTFVGVATGKVEYNGIRGPLQLKDALANINLETEAKNALQELKNAPTSKKDAALKRYVAIERMRRLGVSPDKYMLDKIPVLPPQFRPISTHNGLTMVADSNYLYAQLLDARDDVREARDLPEEYQQQARETLYKDWKELTGLYEPENKAFKAKHIQGLLKWALGDSPKFSAAQRKVIGVGVDTVGRGVITPNPRIKLNQIGLPEAMAFGIFSPLVERALVQRGYTPVDAIKQVHDKTRQAREILLKVMETHPVLMNRAPTLHKLSIMAFNPVLVSGHALQINPSIVVPFGADFDGDTVNIHAPVSDNAREEARRRMFPERNLIAMKNRQIAYKPEKEYTQGLYTASRINDKSTVRPILFKDLAEARAAYRQGLINIDDPIDIQTI